MKYVHVGINVTNLEKSLSFYKNLFGKEPVKTKEDYAKFLLEEPGLNFTLNVRDTVQGNQVNHFGFQVGNSQDVLSHKERLQAAGLKIGLEEESTVCCYARQDKFWVEDPDGNEWEFFFSYEDVEEKKVATACCTK